MTIGLLLILLLVLTMPFISKKVERNLEAFLLIMGLAASITSGVLDLTLLVKSSKDPLVITLAVLLAGFLFRWFQKPIEKGVRRANKKLPFPLFAYLLIVFLGLLSSIITAIIAALVLVSIVSVLRLDRKTEILLVILSCYSIGLGAALTPIGEPLSTIATSKLDEEFFYLLKLIGKDVIPAILAFGLFAAYIIKPGTGTSQQYKLEKESVKFVCIRGIKVYIFVMALTLLGAGFEPFIESYLLGLQPQSLYWINMISAVLDNATLAAAEISPAMNAETIRSILLGLLISGGMLIPGNIPNIIAAGKLNISSTEWARYGVPIGLVTMIIMYIIIRVL